MSRDTRLARTVRRILERQQAKEGQNPKPRLSRVGKVVLFLLGVPGIYIGILSALPRVSVSSPSSLDPSDPFASAFVISNDGYLDLYDVKFRCFPDVLNDFGSHIKVEMNEKPIDWGGISNDQMAASQISPNKRATILCPFPFKLLGGPISRGTLRIAVHFRPEWLPWRVRRVTKFVLAKDASGQFRWLEEP
jgi:hypothetical protein